MEAAQDYLDGTERTVEDRVDLSAAVQLQTMLKTVTSPQISLLVATLSTSMQRERMTSHTM